jgi:hypothetical protein
MIMFRRKPPPPSAEPHVILRCSFCNKSQHDVRRLIAGPNSVHICDECLDICLAIVSEDREHIGGDPLEQSSSGTAAAIPGACALCGLPTSSDQALLVHKRGMVCAGCVREIETALTERDAPPSEPA